MKHLARWVVAALLGFHFATVSAQSGELNLNGIAAFEQLRKEYYIGALYLGWPGPDAATIANMPGRKRMELHITADRWPALRFSQIWNQLITINNPGATINSNAMDILAFTSIPRGDFVEGDHLTIELTANNATQVSVNGVVALRTESPALFNMLLNTWIGQRPPSSEFKRDMLAAPKDKVGTDLLARFNTVKPNDARKKAVAGWGLKTEPEPVAAQVATAPATPAAKPVPAPAPAAAPKKAEAVAAAKPEPEKVRPEAEKARPGPEKTTAPAAAEPAPAVAAAPAPAVDNQHAERQKALRSEYIGQIRKLVVKNIDYPKRAVKDNIEGLVMVRVRVDREGNLAGFEIVQPADDLLDTAAQRAAQKAAPFPKASAELEGAVFETLIPIVFKLTQ